MFAELNCACCSKSVKIKCLHLSRKSLHASRKSMYVSRKSLHA